MEGLNYMTCVIMEVLPCDAVHEQIIDKYLLLASVKKAYETLFFKWKIKDYGFSSEMSY